MPLLKRSFVKLAGVEPGALQSLQARLKQVTFGINSETQVLGTDLSGSMLALELVVRVKQKGLSFDEKENKFVEAKGFDFKRHYFELHAAKGIASTSGATRDFKVLLQVLKGTGAPGADVKPLLVNLAGWAKEQLSTHDSAQLSNITLDNYCSEPDKKLIGRFSAKSIDNRFDPAFLDPPSGSLKSIRMSFFFEGIRRSVEARISGVLALTSSDEEDLEGYANEQQARLLAYASVDQSE